MAGWTEACMDGWKDDKSIEQEKPDRCPTDR